MSTDQQTIHEFVSHCIEPVAGANRLLQYLIKINQHYHYIPAAAIDILANRLALSTVDIQALISFYSFLTTDDPGAYHILISDNITDRMSGNRELRQQLCEGLAEYDVTVEFTSCIGLPDQGVGILVNGRAITQVDTQRARRIIGLIEAGHPLESWPQELFHVRDNIRIKDRQLSTPVEPGLAIERVLDEGADWLLQQLTTSGLRGRGGAGFPTAKKWRLCRGFQSDARYVVCNADEGEPGTFKDRVLLHTDADAIIEGMTLCARTINAHKGFIYLRSEYRHMLDALEDKLRSRRQQGLLGDNILGHSDYNFDIEIHLGAGAYICGEESALIESLQGKRGLPRVRPPFPVESGYLYRPTVVDNVETFWSAARIALKGGEWFSEVGTDESSGTRLISVSGDCESPGIYEYPFGTGVDQVLRDCGGENAQAVQVSGAAGHMAFRQEFQRQLSFEDLSCGGSFMVFGPQRNVMDILENFAQFFCHESCGFCTPCRNGTTQLVRHMNNFRTGKATHHELEQMKNLFELMAKSSFCGLGCSVPTAFQDVLHQAPQTFEDLIVKSDDNPDFDVNEQLTEFRRLASENREVQDA